MSELGQGVTTLEELRTLLGRAAVAVARGRMDPKVGHALAAVAGQLAKVLGADSGQNADLDALIQQARLEIRARVLPSATDDADRARLAELRARSHVAHVARQAAGDAEPDQH